MKYVNIENGTNKLLGWYSDDVHSEIPTPNIEVTDEVWQEALRINANCYENGKFIFKDFRTDEEIKEARIIAINSKVEEIITKPYPIYKQLNIRGQLLPYTMDDLENMNMFIDIARYIGKDAKSNGTKVEDINWAGLDEYLSSDEITESDLLSIRQLVKAV